MNGQKRRKSELTSVEKITSSNKNAPRNKVIRRLTPHCVAGNLSIETALGLAKFHDGKTASTNYAIGTDGRIGIGVEETNRAWTSSSSVNDQEAITFEIANNGLGPDWRMSDLAINAWLDLAVDICRFYGYKKAHYEVKPSNVGVFPIANFANANVLAVENWVKTWAKGDEMIITLHCWYANKACPGPYFMRQLPWLVREMNKRLQDPLWIPEKFVGESATYPTLKNGSKGEEVKEAQRRLNAHGALLTVDGGFGALTQTAVRAFQFAKGLAVDGAIGPATWVELLKSPTVIAIETISPVETPTIPAPISTMSDSIPSIPDPAPFKEYKAQVNGAAVNVRKGPGANCDVVTCLRNDKNIYTIVDEVKDREDKVWCKLKSGIGWIRADLLKRI